MAEGADKPFIEWETEDLAQRHLDYENAVKYLELDDPDRADIQRDLRHIAFELGCRGVALVQNETA